MQTVERVLIKRQMYDPEAGVLVCRAAAERAIALAQRKLDEDARTSMPDHARAFVAGEGSPEGSPDAGVPFLDDSSESGDDAEGERDGETPVRH